MARPRKTPTPLDTVISARVPRDVADRWKGAAVEVNLGFSDWLRQAVDGDRVRLSWKPTPQVRPKAAIAPSGADPVLLRQLSAIGANLNQIARALNTRCAAGQDFSVVELLVVLRVIERHLQTVAAIRSFEHAHKVPTP